MNVIVTLTTIPSRLSSDYENGIKSCIGSLVNQSYEDYEIHFNIPYINKFLNEEYTIPNWLLEQPKIKIFRTEDLGPATKLIPTVERIIDPETIIIVADDDLVYHTDMVKEQVINQVKFPEAIVGYDGLRSRNEDGTFSTHFGDVRDYYYTSNYRDSKVDILQHYKTISYKRRFFDLDFTTFVDDHYSWSDDILLAAYFSLKKRDRIATYHESDLKFNSHQEWVERGGVYSFPVLTSTSHERKEGCNLYREVSREDNGNVLYRFIDKGYLK